MSELQHRLAAGLKGRYIVERPLGEGGMAIVFLARDLRHERPVAIKVMRPDVSAEIGAERFLREIRMAASLTHPHILPVFDSGSADGLLFYVMPNMEGQSLRDRLDKEGQLALEDALRITSEVASALDYSHRQNVLHRDIKPENILLHEGAALLADFGIGKSLGSTGQVTTQTGFTVGTPAYMSPEQASGDRVIDGRSDLYSLGCVIYEMLTGEPPFTGPNAQAIIAKRFMSPVPSVKVMRNVPDAVEAAVSRVLSRSAADRYRNGAEFGDALRAILRTGETPGVRVSAEKHAIEPKAIAVLPFANMSPDPENEYFSDGMTEEIINALAKVPGVQVASRSSTFAFKGKKEMDARQIGERLRVSSVLDGSVRKIGIRIRLSAELVNVENGYQLWSETYDRKLEDVFAVQDEISRAIVEALKVKLGAAAAPVVAPTKNIDAYTTYLKARYHFNKFNEHSFRKAIDLFKAAIARDPSFALAWANLAMTYIEFAEMGSMDPNVAFASASEAAKNAVSLDPDLGVAHTAIGYVKFAHDYDWAGAEKELKLGIELNPNAADAFNFYGRFCASVGRYDEAVTLNRRARELDPIAHMLDAVTALLRAGRYDEAIREAKDAREYDPEYDRAMATLGWSYFLSGRQDEGIAELENAVAASPENTTWLGQLGEAYALAGKKEKAEEVLRKLQDRASKGFVSPYHIAYVYVGLGNFDKAVDYLEQAVEKRTGPTYGISGSFLLAPLRSHPGFRALLRKMNLDS